MTEDRGDSPMTSRDAKLARGRRLRDQRREDSIYLGPIAMIAAESVQHHRTNPNLMERFSDSNTRSEYQWNERSASPKTHSSLPTLRLTASKKTKRTDERNNSQRPPEPAHSHNFSQAIPRQ